MRLKPLTSKIVGGPTEANLGPTDCPGDDTRGLAGQRGLAATIISPEESVTSPKSLPVYVDCACRAIEEANIIATHADIRKHVPSGAASIGPLLGHVSSAFDLFLLLPNCKEVKVH